MILLRSYPATFLVLLLLMAVISNGCVLPGTALKRYLPEGLPLDGTLGEIRLLVWNLGKGEYGGVEALVEALNPTILCLQEVPDPQERVPGYYSAFASNLELNGRPYGLSLISREMPEMVRRLLSSGREPLTRTRKQVLACRYGTGDRAVLVLNVHALNLTSVGSYEQQLRSLEAMLDPHSGPVILCGDFNTWSGGRERVLDRWTARYGLAAVDFGPETERIRRFLRSSPFDRVYVRGLRVQEGSADVLEQVGGSDHLPLFVVLEMPPAAQVISASSSEGGKGVAPAWVATQEP